MKKKYISGLILILLLLISFELFDHSNSIIDTVKQALKIWQNNIFPSLFPFFIVSELLIKFGFVELVGEIFKPIMSKIFKISGHTSFVLIMSLITGFPSNAKFTRKLYDENLINEHEATKILTFTHFSNPLFILGTVAYTFIGNPDVGIILISCHYVSNIIVGILFRNYYISKTKDRFSLKQAFSKMHKKRLENQLPFGNMLTEAIMSTLNTLLLILGVLTVFLIFSTLILKNINVSPYFETLIKGFLEITQGLNNVSILKVPLKVKTILSVMFLSFGGLSVHLQIISIISGTNIKYLPFLTARLLHAGIGSLITYIAFDIFYY